MSGTDRAYAALRVGTCVSVSADLGVCCYDMCGTKVGQYKRPQDTSPATAKSTANHRPCQYALCEKRNALHVPGAVQRNEKSIAKARSAFHKNAFNLAVAFEACTRHCQPKSSQKKREKGLPFASETQLIWAVRVQLYKTLSAKETCTQLVARLEKMSNTHL
eukprot:1448006-Rhodomonas_salina.3